MPELPEVETVKNVLNLWVKNKKIRQIRVLYSPLIENANEAKLNDLLVGKTIQTVERKGKFLIFVIEDFVLISHLRMEGKYYYGHYKEDLIHQDGISFDLENRMDTQQNKHVHFIIELEDGHLLLYHDTRKFGRIQLLESATYMTKPPLNKLGNEPFHSYTKEFLHGKLSCMNKTIKQALLDQTLIAGLGNIYVDEVCFLSKILPTTSTKEITLMQCGQIIENAIFVLNKAIELGGSTIRSYHVADHVDGKFQNQLYVYGRQSQPCLICSTPILKIKVAGRGTHYCPKCQK